MRTARGKGLPPAAVHLLEGSEWEENPVTTNATRVGCVLEGKPEAKAVGMNCVPHSTHKWSSQ